MNLSSPPTTSGLNLSPPPTASGPSLSSGPRASGLMNEPPLSPGGPAPSSPPAEAPAPSLEAQVVRLGLMTSAVVIRPRRTTCASSEGAGASAGGELGAGPPGLRGGSFISPEARGPEDRLGPDAVGGGERFSPEVVGGEDRFIVAPWC